MKITLTLLVAVKIHEIADKLRIFLTNTTKQGAIRRFVGIFVTAEKTGLIQ
jgi:hypothetical protein